MDDDVDVDVDDAADAEFTRQWPVLGVRRTAASSHLRGTDATQKTRNAQAACIATQDPCGQG
jgi:hypothetical protein